MLSHKWNVPIIPPSGFRDLVEEGRHRGRCVTPGNLGRHEDRSVVPGNLGKHRDRSVAPGNLGRHRDRSVVLGDLGRHKDRSSPWESGKVQGQECSS